MFSVPGGDGEAFNCPEGKILTLGQICNGIPECQNGEDEFECALTEEDKIVLEDYGFGNATDTEESYYDYEAVLDQYQDQPRIF